MIRRGALLLETMLALSIFVAAGASIFTLVDGSLTSLERARLAEQAADHARSAMAKIEAGIATAQTLHGPMRSWREVAIERGDLGPAAFDEDAEPSAWELDIDTEPSEFAGLTRVSVTALRRAGGAGAGEKVIASYTLRQLVRLGEQAEDKAGDLDELAEEAGRASASEGARR